jgi:predicted O-methyltransferase YrrM
MNLENSLDRDADAQQVRRVIERLVRDGSVVAISDGAKRRIFPVAVSPGEAEILRDWVYREGATQTIEIGLAYGFSAIHICEGLLLNGKQTVRHVVLDPNQSTGFANCGLQVLEEAGVRKLVEHHAEESQIALPQFLKEERSFDLGFIDGNHRFDRVFLDLFYLGHLVRKGGIVILDDYNQPGIKRAVSFFVTNLNWKIEETNEEGHQAVLRTAQEADNRTWDFFVEF